MDKLIIWGFNHRFYIKVSSVQLISRVRLFATLWIPAHQASLSITNSQSLQKLMPIESVMPSSHFILCCPFLLLPPIPPSIRVFSNESTLHMRWPKYWFQLQHQSLQWTPRTYLLQDGLVGSPCSPSDSQEYSEVDCQHTIKTSYYEGDHFQSGHSIPSLKVFMHRNGFLKYNNNWQQGKRI